MNLLSNMLNRHGYTVHVCALVLDVSRSVCVYLTQVNLTHASFPTPINKSYLLLTTNNRRPPPISKPLGLKPKCPHTAILSIEFLSNPSHRHAATLLSFWFLTVCNIGLASTYPKAPTSSILLNRIYRPPCISALSCLAWRHAAPFLLFLQSQGLLTHPNTTINIKCRR